MTGTQRRALLTRLLAALLLITAFASRANAVPSFAAQTGQPCQTCHIGSFGPQLTPFGREFKIEGYTMTGGEGLASKIPLSAMVLGSFTNTAANQPEGAAPHFGTNNNFAADQVSLFFAGRITDFAGAFVQGTYSGVDRAFLLDNTDFKLTTPLSLDDTELRIGAGGWQYAWGNANPLLYPPAPVTGSANGKPNSNAFIIEADWIPFGKEDSWLRPFANLKIGLQYKIYTQFNGGNRNYDGSGRNASGNNTLFLYAWLAF